MSHIATDVMDARPASSAASKAAPALVKARRCSAIQAKALTSAGAALLAALDAGGVHDIGGYVGHDVLVSF